MYCPICGKCSTIELIEEILFPSPSEPSLKCNECGTLWRIEIFEVKKKECLQN